jgi:flagellar biosynthesis GTPase FlhF
MPAAALAEIGHNNPPPLREVLAENYEILLTEIEALAGKANEAPKTISGDEDVITVGEIVKGARDLSKRLDKARDAEGRPHLEAKREIDGFFKGHMERIDRIAQILQKRADDYQRARAAEERRKREEEARRLREEEERQREIARKAEEANRAKTAAKHEDKADELAERRVEAEASAQASNADLVRVRSDTGTVVSAKTEWKGEIVSVEEIDLNKLRPYLKRDDVQKALNTFVRMGGRELAGARIFEDVKASFR